MSVLSTYLGKRAKHYGAKEIKLIPVFGVDTNIFKPNLRLGKISRQNHGFKEEPIIFAPIRYSPEKGIDCLIDAFALLKKEIKNAKLLMAGYGPDEQRLKERVKSLGLEKDIYFMPFLKRNETPSYYNMCDVCVMPSLEEGLGFGAAEALACEKPVVSTNAGGLTDIALNGKTAIVVKPKDKNELAKALIKLLTDKKLAEKLAKEGRKHVKRVYERKTAMNKMKIFLKNISGKD